MYWSPKCVFITRVPMVPIPTSTSNEVTKVLNSSVTSGSGHASGSGTTGSGGIDPSTSMQGPLLD
jgi:hypothetical protein